MTRTPLDPHSATAAELKARMAAERRGSPFLIYCDADGRQVILELKGRGVSVGRRAENDVPLAWDQEVSRLHAELEHIKGEWTVVDDGLSRNGSYLNGERIRGRRRLKDGDRLCFGTTMVVYRALVGGDSKSSTIIPSSATSVHLSETQRKILVVLCRPVGLSAFATPATNRAIAEELFLSVDAVKAHLRVLFERFGLQDLPQNEKRSSLASAALLSGTISVHDL